jgi:hypothetical protein
MSKFIPDAIMDLALEDISDNGDHMDLCNAQPADYADIASHSLGQVELTLGAGMGDYTLGDGDVSGRKLTVGAQSITGTGTGTATHIVISDSAGSAIKAITTCTIPVVDESATPVNAYDVWEIRDPS